MFDRSSLAPIYMTFGAPYSAYLSAGVTKDAKGGDDPTKVPHKTVNSKGT